MLVNSLPGNSKLPLTNGNDTETTLYVPLPLPTSSTTPFLASGVISNNLAVKIYGSLSSTTLAPVAV